MSKDKVNADIITALERLKQNMELSKKKRIEKLFVSIANDSNLIDSLNTYTKDDLNNIRQSLKLSGVSSLKKADLACVLESKIKTLLPSIIEKFTDVEYKLITKVIKNNGYLKFEQEQLEVILYLRKYGIVFNLLKENQEKYIVIPKDILEDLTLLLNRLDVIHKIKLNEKVNKLSIYQEKSQIYYHTLTLAQRVRLHMATLM